MSNPRRSNGAARNRVKRRVLQTETYCHLCGQAVDKRLPHGLPGSPELDELVPVSFGGSPYDRRNVRLAHRWCNRKRSTLPIDQARSLIMIERPTFNVAGLIVATELEPVVSRDW